MKKIARSDRLFFEIRMQCRQYETVLQTTERVQETDIQFFLLRRVILRTGRVPRGRLWFVWGFLEQSHQNRELLGQVDTV